MKTRNILRSIGLTVLAAFAGTTLFFSCSREELLPADEPALVETPVQNTVHVTLDASIADDAATRASYGYGAADPADRKVTIENGDKLFVRVIGTDDAWDYCGVLSNTAEAPNTFSGDLTSISGTYSGPDIITAAKWLKSILLPKGYEEQDYITISGGTVTLYGPHAFADGDFSSSVPLVCNHQYLINNAAGAEKNVILSLEDAVLCFTISGLTPNADHAVSLSNGSSSRNGTTHTNGSGIATFSFGYGAASAKTYTLSIDGYEPIPLGEKTLEAGHLYKINRTATKAPVNDWANLNVGDVILADDGTTPIAITVYQSGGHGYAIALTDARPENCGGITGDQGTVRYKWYTANEGSCTRDNSSNLSFAQAFASSYSDAVTWTNTLSTPSCTEGHVHKAAKAACGFNVAIPTDAPTGTQWVLPSAGMWIEFFNQSGTDYTITSSGAFGWQNGSSKGGYYNTIKKKWNATTSTGFGSSSFTMMTDQFSYWSSSEYSSERAVLVQFNSYYGFAMVDDSKSNSNMVRPFLAF